MQRAEKAIAADLLREVDADEQALFDVVNEMTEIVVNHEHKWMWKLQAASIGTIDGTHLAMRRYAGRYRIGVLYEDGAFKPWQDSPLYTRVQTFRLLPDLGEQVVLMRQTVMHDAPRILDEVLTELEKKKL